MLKAFAAKIGIEPAIHFLIWASFFTVVWFEVRSVGQFRKQDGSIYPPMIWSTMFNMALFYFNAVYLIPRFFSRHRYALYFLLMLALYIGIVLTNTAFDHFYSISIFSSEKESFVAESILNLITKTLVLSLSLGYGLTKNWFISNKLQQQLISDKLTAQLKYLKAQINPHFLFNTLNMAFASAVKNKDEVTADIIEKLSVLMRYVLYESNEDKVPLENELHYIDNYINLQLQRLSTEIAHQVKYNVIGSSQNLQIAPMILIPFIENVFKHGVMLTKKPEMSITIHLYHDSLLLETRNLKNAASAPSDKSNSGIGMKNAKERLQLLYPNRHKLQVSDGDYFEIKLEIQLKPFHT